MSATSSEAPIELTIVMPCLNEAETLETCIRKAFDFLNRHGIRGEVVVGDNGSTDGSQRLPAGSVHGLSMCLRAAMAQHCMGQPWQPVTLRHHGRL
jgi:Glycosyltransferases involved in cell wall biogenesis